MLYVTVCVCLYFTVTVLFAFLSHRDTLFYVIKHVISLLRFTGLATVQLHAVCFTLVHDAHKHFA